METKLLFCPCLPEPNEPVDAKCVWLLSSVAGCRDGEEGCKKQLGRVLSIWQERAVYENNLLDQLSSVLREFLLQLTRVSQAGCAHL